MANKDLAALIDLETLGTSKNSIVLSIGAALINPNAGIVFPEGCQPFESVISRYWVLNAGEQMNLGRTIDLSTLGWWMNQEKVAQTELNKSLNNLGSTRWALEELMLFIADAGTVWGYGSDFDLSMMESLFRTFGMKTPWHYRNARCLRTLEAEIPPCPDFPSPHENPAHIAHRADSDAIVEALVLQQIYTTKAGVMAGPAVSEAVKAEAGVQLELDLGE